MISARVIQDSISPDKVRLTTLSLTYPRFILAEVNTHRMLSKNSASSRAMSVNKMLTEVVENPALPVWWGKEQRGMQAREGFLYDRDHEFLRSKWLSARDFAVFYAGLLADYGLHKQTVNRLLEPFSHAQTVVTATEWDNFFILRRHKDAQPEMKALADAMHDAMEASAPKAIAAEGWHMPYADDIKCSVARCARVSYAKSDSQSDTEKDIALHDRLKQSGHWSPFEHQATPADGTKFYANFRGWLQYRHAINQDNG